MQEDKQSRKLHTESSREADPVKDEFLANMSHELRSPINAILGMDEMILRESRDDTVTKYALSIQSAGRTLLALVNEILDYSKIEAGNMEIVPDRYELSSLIRESYNMIALRANKKDLAVYVENDPQIPSILFGDEVRLRQIFTNILTNAVKYTKEGHVRMIIGFEREPAPVPESLMGTLKHKLGAVIGTAKEKMPASVTEMEETVKEKYAAAKEKMPTSVGEVEELVKEKYAAAKEKMPTSVGEVEELVKEKYAAAKEKMPSSVGEVEELVKGTYAAAKEKIPTAAEVKEKLEEVREKIQDYKGE